jgi:multidrug resistance efflux pump
MLAAILILIAAAAIFWLVFFKFKLLRLTPGWGFIFALFMIHVLLVFMIGLRFVTPVSANATIVQHTIQLVPRLSEPTLVTAVLVEDNTEVKKDQPLFQFDRTLYEARVAQLEAELAAAKQNVDILKANVEAAKGAVARASADLDWPASGFVDRQLS